MEYTDRLLEYEERLAKWEQDRQSARAAWTEHRTGLLRAHEEELARIDALEEAALERWYIDHAAWQTACQKVAPTGKFPPAPTKPARLKRPRPPVYPPRPIDPPRPVRPIRPPSDKPPGRPPITPSARKVATSLSLSLEALEVLDKTAAAENSNRSAVAERLILEAGKAVTLPPELHERIRAIAGPRGLTVDRALVDIIEAAIVMLRTA